MKKKTAVSSVLQHGFIHWLKPIKDERIMQKPQLSQYRHSILKWFSAGLVNLRPTGRMQLADFYFAYSRWYLLEMVFF